MSLKEAAFKHGAICFCKSGMETLTFYTEDIYVRRYTKGEYSITDILRL